MSTATAIHERFMNDSGTILPRVGGGVGVGVGVRENTYFPSIPYLCGGRSWVAADAAAIGGGRR